MPNNPFINQMNIQGTLYDLNDSRLQNDSVEGVDYIYTSTPFWFDEGARFEGNAAFTAGVTINGDEAATQPWVLSQISSISVDNVLTLKGSVSSSGGMATIYNAGAETGDTYIVTESFAWGTNPRHDVEPGDLFVCSDGYSAGSGSSANWTVIQGNIIGDDSLAHYRGTVVDLDEFEEVDMVAGDFWVILNGGYVDYSSGACGLAVCIRDWRPEGEGDSPIDPENPHDSIYLKLIGPDNEDYLQLSGTATTGQILTWYSTGGWSRVRAKDLLAGSGLSVASTSSSITFSHSNSVTAGAFGPSASASGISFALPYVQYDAQGHISSVASFTHTIPTFVPATSSAAGESGLLPGMSSLTSEQETWVLYANGTWGPQLGSGDEGYTLPLAASGTRGGLQVGYATDRTSGYFAVQLESEKAYVAVPTFTGATSQANGDIGLVPQAMASASQTFLRADGAWADVAYVSSNILYM